MRKLLPLLFSNKAEILPENRPAVGSAAGVVGMLLNLLLAAVKAFVGFAASSVSIVADAANNLTDALSSVATFIGFRIAAKPADEEHPYGHARSEYVAGLFVSVSMLFLAVELLKSAIQKLLKPTAVELSVLSAVLLALAILAKLFLYWFYRRLGAKLSSATLFASARDSLGDVAASSVVLLCALFSRFFGFSLDGLGGLLVSVFLLVSGVRCAVDTISPLLGTAPPKELVEHIETKIRSFDSVLGTHDLVVHSYGESRRFVSVHVEFDAREDIVKSHDVADAIERAFLLEDQIQLVVHLDPVVCDDPLANEVRAKLDGYLQSIDERLSSHDFRVVYTSNGTNFIFDISVPVKFPIPDLKLRHLVREFFSELDESYNPIITLDHSFVSSV